MKGLVIESVVSGSISDEFGVEAGDRLLAVNGERLRDLIDYSYYTAGEPELLLEIEKADGEIWELEIEREQDEPLGLLFPPPQPARCRNKCVFCFVHQLPKGLRKPLYVKDEDYRLSFLNGNYVTLANLKPSELSRIIEQRLSPLYISVHTTNPLLREQLLGVKGIPPILKQLKQLTTAGITLHTQVVLCPGLNDGKELEKTVADLADLFPAVQSLAVVPLGVTRHRKGLPDLQPVDGTYSAEFISLWEDRGKALKKRLGNHFLFLADEFYLKADRPFPPLRDYGDLPQIENGVGMVPLFLRESRKVIRQARPIGNFRVTVVTGVSSFGIISDFAAGLTEKTGIEIVPKAVENRLFGSSVTVTGLVTGKDIVSALTGGEIGTALLIPDVMLKEGEGVFLDDMTLDELGKQLGCRAIFFQADPLGFYHAIKEIKRLGLV